MDIKWPTLYIAILLALILCVGCTNASETIGTTMTGSTLREPASSLPVHTTVKPTTVPPATTDISQTVSGDGDITPSNGRVIYLTFDDGPSCYTEKLLDVLDRYGVKATFFVVNNGYVHLLDDIVQRGHTIAIHASCHIYSQIYASEEAYFADMTLMRDIIYAQTGVYTNLLRFPGGSSNTVSCFNPGIMTRLTRAVEDMGYAYFDWNVDSNDAGGAVTPAAVARNVIAGCKNQQVSVVLQHDTKGYSVDAVESIILWGLENGYTFQALNEFSPVIHHNIAN